ncbi:hypothetical protein IFR05_013424 [Cadophora sp. M221]|nr:hypothetical protein IFR05_013424 [Cadophora sp. M221]
MHYFTVLLVFLPCIAALPTTTSYCIPPPFIVNSCSTNPGAVEGSKIIYTTFPCPFSLSAFYHNQTAPFIVYSFNPNNPRGPSPISFFGTKQPSIQFKLTNGVIDTYNGISTVPATDGKLYHQYLIHTSDDPYGAQQVILSDEIIQGVSESVDGRLQYRCVDGVSRLVLLPPDGRSFYTETSDLFDGGVPQPWGIDSFESTMENWPSDRYHNIDVLVDILWIP